MTDSKVQLPFDPDKAHFAFYRKDCRILITQGHHAWELYAEPYDLDALVCREGQEGIHFEAITEPDPQKEGSYRVHRSCLVNVGNSQKWLRLYATQNVESIEPLELTV